MRCKVETYWDASKAAIRVRPVMGQNITIKNVQFPREMRTAIGLRFTAELIDAGKFWRASSIRPDYAATPIRIPVADTPKPVAKPIVQPKRAARRVTLMED